MNTLPVVVLPAPALTTREKRDLAHAERVISRGLKSFIEVGMSLKEIRDRKLYREQHRTFEGYCSERWDFTRARAYQICAASEAVTDLSTNVDSAVLPKNEGQARPLTRLKSARHRKQAWLLAIKTARAEARPVTARDVETAVYAVARNGKDRLTGQYWVTPPELYARLERDYGPFDFDPCPYPRPDGFDGLTMAWGKRNYVNPPFRDRDALDGKGPMAFARKAVVEQRLGKTSVVVLPVPKYVAPLLEAGAEVRLIGRVDWHDVKTGEQRSNGNPIVCFVLRGQRRADPPEGTRKPIG